MRSAIQTESVLLLHKGSASGTTIQIAASMTRADLPGAIHREDGRKLYTELTRHLPNGTRLELKRLFLEEK